MIGKIKQSIKKRICGSVIPLVYAEEDLHPLEAIHEYHAYGLESVVIQVDASACVINTGIALDNHELQPRVKTLAWLSDSQDQDPTKSPLQIYHDHLRQLSVEERIGIERGAAPRMHAYDTGITVVTPWGRRSENIGKKARERLPAEKVERLKKTLDSIKKSGYDPENNGGHIKANILVDGKKYAVMTASGNHRSACLSYLGWKKIPVVVSRVINRDEAWAWPMVRKNVMKIDQAQACFDKLVAKQPIEPPLSDYLSPRIEYRS